MKKIILLAFLALGFMVSNSQEDISLIKLELYGGDVTYNGFTTGGKELPLYFSVKHNKILCSEEFEMYPDSNYYPVIARIRIFKKTSIFPNNLSLRIDLEYVKTVQGRKRTYEIIGSEKGITNSKILGRDSKDENKFYIDRHNEKPDEFYLYKDNETGRYRIGYLTNYILSNILVVRNLVATIREGVRL